jgi:hypothetical protein
VGVAVAVPQCRVGGTDPTVSRYGFARRYVTAEVSFVTVEWGEGETSGRRQDKVEGAVRARAGQRLGGVGADQRGAGCTGRTARPETRGGPPSVSASGAARAIAQRPGRHRSGCTWRPSIPEGSSSAALQDSRVHGRADAVHHRGGRRSRAVGDFDCCVRYGSSPSVAVRADGPAPTSELLPVRAEQVRYGSFRSPPAPPG